MRITKKTPRTFALMESYTSNPLVYAASEKIWKLAEDLEKKLIAAQNKLDAMTGRTITKVSQERAL